MIKYILIAAIATTVFFGSWGYGERKALRITPSTPVTKVLASLGKDYKDKKPLKSVPGVSAEAGEMLFKQGFAEKVKGGKTKKQSKHFVCTSCHNVEKEEMDLSVSDPQARLEYTAKENLPFLQGTTMYGAVTRETYYNGDYSKKYGDLVEPARNDIRGAIQLCAVECAQGRSLNTWELESILAYLWTLDLKIEDLQLSESELADLENGTITDDEKITLVQSKFLQGSPAHFIPPPVDRKAGTGLEGDPENGKLIYVNSCMHCHYRKKYSFLHLDTTRLSFSHLKKKAATYHNHSLYQVTRWGVPSKSGKSSYMPQYPVEKMSDQQLTDLMSYIDQQSQ